MAAPALVQVPHVMSIRQRAPRFQVVIGVMVVATHVPVPEISVRWRGQKVLAQLSPTAIGVMKEHIAGGRTILNVWLSLSLHAKPVVLGVYGRLLVASVPGQVLGNVQRKIRNNVTQQKAVVNIFRRVAA